SLQKRAEDRIGADRPEIQRAHEVGVSRAERRVLPRGSLHRRVDRCARERHATATENREKEEHRDEAESVRSHFVSSIKATPAPPDSLALVRPERRNAGRAGSAQSSMRDTPTYMGEAQTPSGARWTKDKAAMKDGDYASIEIDDEAIVIDDETIDESDEAIDVDDETIEIDDATNDESDEPIDVYDEVIEESDEPIEIIDGPIDEGDETIDVDDDPIEETESLLDYRKAPTRVSAALTSEPASIMEATVRMSP
ncbi:MAG TPA: hypothetical protein VMI75_22330, partial [Polyangiaceae bacterium]|nr:hypothetical protein [Polyangiaceae bacterium]